jgi:LPS O-antigen subunit length determinant protein (WzzB/FepE family)
MGNEQSVEKGEPQLVYVVRQEGSSGQSELDVAVLASMLWRAKWLVVASVVVFAALGAAYAFTATQWFQADAVLSPVGKKSLPGGLAQLGGLASLAGIEIPSADNGEPLAVLRSRTFVRDFIEDRALMPVLYAAQWNAAAKEWAVPEAQRPDIRDAVAYFDQSIRIVTEDKKSGLVTLSIRWKDPVLAADWANMLVSRLNERLRAQAIREAQTSIEYLQKEMTAGSIVSLQQSIGRVLESEMQKMALARANAEFAFKVVDSATPPRYRSSPRRGLVLVLFALLGFAVAAGVVIVRSLVMNSRQRGNGA